MGSFLPKNALLLYVLLIGLFSSTIRAQVITTTTTNTTSRCYNNGSLTVNASGGTAPYTDSIISGPANPNIFYPIGLPTGTYTFTDLPGGSYIVIVHDAAGHIDTITGTVGGNYQFPLFNFAQHNLPGYIGEYFDTLFCIAVAGTGTPPFEYAISSTGSNSGFGPYQSQDFFTHICPGTYWVRMQDSCGNIYTSSYVYNYKIQLNESCVNFNMGILTVAGVYANSTYRYVFRTTYPSSFYYSSTGDFTGLPHDFSGYVSVYDSCGVADSFQVIESNVQVKEICPFDSTIRSSGTTIFPDTTYITCTDCTPVQTIMVPPNTAYPTILFDHVNSTTNYNIVIDETNVCGYTDSISCTLTHPNAQQISLNLHWLDCNSFTVSYLPIVFDSFALINSSGHHIASVPGPIDSVTFRQLVIESYTIYGYTSNSCYIYSQTINPPHIGATAELVANDSCQFGWEIAILNQYNSLHEDFSVVTPSNDTIPVPYLNGTFDAIFGMTEAGWYTINSDSGCAIYGHLDSIPRYEAYMTAYTSCTGTYTLRYQDTVYNLASLSMAYLKVYNQHDSLIRDSVGFYHSASLNWQFTVSDTGWYHYELFISYNEIIPDSSIIRYDTLCPIDTGSVYLSGSRVPYPLTDPIYECGRTELPDYTIVGGSVPYTVEIAGVDTVIINTNTSQFPTDSPGTYTMIVYDNCGISRSYTFSLIDTCTVLPCPTLSAGSDTLICAGGQVTLHATASSGGGSYLWSPGGYTSPAITVSPSITTSYIVTYTKASCHSVSDTVIITVTSPASLSVQGDTTICEGDSAILRADPSVSGGSYLWSANAATTSSVTVSPSITSLYAVTYTIAGCAPVTDSLTVTISPPATVSILHDTSICRGDSVRLNATAAPTGGTFSWSPGGAASQGITVSPASSVTYSVTYDAGACSATDTAFIYVVPVPTLSGANQFICTGNSATISVTPSVTGGTYFWTPGNDTTQSITVSPAITTVYAASYTTICGTITASDTVFVTSSPTVQVPDTGLCSRDSATLRAAASPPGGLYIWSPGGDTTTMITVAPSATTAYTVLYTLAGCPQTSSTDTVTVYPDPILSLQAMAISCFGLADGSVTAQVNAGSGPYTYQWSNQTAGTIDSGLTAGIYSLTISDRHHCTASASDTITAPAPASIEVMPSDTTIFQGASVQLTSVFAGYPLSAINSYSWTPAAGLSCINCQDPIVSSSKGSDSINVYKLTVIYNGSCTITVSDTIWVAGTGDVYLIAPQAFSPNNDGINDHFTLFAKGIAEYDLRIYNRWGQLVYETTDLSELNNTNKGWDGSYQGEPQPVSTFVWYVNATDYFNHKIFKDGNVTLLK